MSPPSSQRCRNWIVAPSALLLFGCAQMPQLGSKESPPPASSTSTSAAAPAAAEPAPVLPSRPMTVDELFAKRKVTGLDLIFQIKIFGRLAARRDALREMASVDAAAPAGAGNQGSGKPPSTTEALMAAGMQNAFKPIENLLKDKLVPLKQSVLGDYIESLTGDLQALRRETVTLPSAQYLSPKQKQRAVTLAALVVATRMTHRLMDQARQDLANLDNEYKELIERRERAAQLLQQALASTVPPGVFADSELAQLREMSRRMGVADFAKDMGAQNLALRLAKAADPTAYADYQRRTEGLTRRQAASLRTLGGTVSYAGLLTKFGIEMTKLSKAKTAELITISTLVLEFVVEVPKVMTTSFDVYTAGTNALIASTRSFRVTINGQTQEVANSAAVFDLMAKNGAATELQSALFRDGNRGLLQAVHACDPTTTGQMLDVALSAGQREAFATEMNLPEPDSFSFGSVLGSGDDAKAGIAEDLLGRDHRPRLADRRNAMAKVQFAVAGGDSQPAERAARPGYVRWNNDQLLRMVFVNRDGSAAQYAAMEVAGVIVKPVPSMQSLYAYETLADACRTQFSAPTETRTPPASRPTVPRPARPTPPAVPASPIPANPVKKS